MQIIVPMSGFGERFRREGYLIPKPLIPVDGKPIIAHIVDMFPGEKKFIFICNEDHLNEPDYRMRHILQQICPTGQVVGIAPHKHGPVYTVSQALNYIDSIDPVIVNYCDFACYWDWAHFKMWVQRAECDGAVPAYRNFHPHTLGTTNYAYIRERNGWMLDIQEKQPYTENRMNEYASSGTYYFSSGKLMSHAFREAMKQNLHVNHEYYVSLAYKILLANNRRVAIYDLQHFMQWGTPEDLTEYQNWSSIFNRLSNKVSDPLALQYGVTIIPMAGLGQRFKKEDYVIDKPLIPISGQPMVLQATDDLPRTERYVFVLRRDMPGFETIRYLIQEKYPNVIIEAVPEMTEGQACTALLGLKAFIKQCNEEILGPIIFGACDNGIFYNNAKLEALLQEESTDVIVWGIRGHVSATRHPRMFSWIDHENSLIKRISVKKQLNSPKTDPIVIGTFIFKRAEDFRRCVESMMQKNTRVNEEFYIDTCINDAVELGLCCKLFEVEGYISWGTPDDLRTFEYWQSCFHKWESHPYRLQNDSHLSVSMCQTLEKRYQATQPKLPKF